jgi:hypothetical protein
MSFVSNGVTGEDKEAKIAGRKGRKSCAKDAKIQKEIKRLLMPSTHRSFFCLCFYLFFLVTFLRLLRNFCALCVR